MHTVNTQVFPHNTNQVSPSRQFFDLETKVYAELCIFQKFPSRGLEFNVSHSKSSGPVTRHNFRSQNTQKNCSFFVYFVRPVTLHLFWFQPQDPLLAYFQMHSILTKTVNACIVSTVHYTHHRCCRAWCHSVWTNCSHHAPIPNKKKQTLCEIGTRPRKLLP